MPFRNSASGLDKILLLQICPQLAAHADDSCWKNVILELLGHDHVEGLCDQGHTLADVFLRSNVPRKIMSVLPLHVGDIKIRFSCFLKCAVRGIGSLLVLTSLMTL